MPSDADIPCPRCGTPAAAWDTECARCGIVFGKWRPPAPTAGPSLPAPVPEIASDDASFERRVRLFAVPAALVLARLVVATSVGKALVRMVFAMPVHETGHAVTALLCGFPALPALWFTPTAESRSFVLILLLSGGLGFLAWRSMKQGLRPTAALFAVLLTVQLFLSVAVRSPQAKALILFGGDGGCFVLGSLLVACFYARFSTQAMEGGLRWGLLMIGAFAFADAAGTWWAARHDFDSIPFGEIDGVGLSDPSRLVQDFGWGELQLVNRYLALMAACLVALAVLYVAGLRRTSDD